MLTGDTSTLTPGASPLLLGEVSTSQCALEWVLRRDAVRGCCGDAGSSPRAEPPIEAASCARCGGFVDRVEMLDGLDVPVLSHLLRPGLLVGCCCCCCSRRSAGEEASSSDACCALVSFTAMPNVRKRCSSSFLSRSRCARSRSRFSRACLVACDEKNYKIQHEHLAENLSCTDKQRQHSQAYHAFLRFQPTLPLHG